MNDLNQQNGPRDQAKNGPPLDGLLSSVLVVENAIHFSPPESEVRIDAAATDDTVMITVTDQGKGMTAEDIQIAGEIFQQVDASDTKEVYGLGLGLPLARLFVELHGGELKIDSTIGGGTVVTISIPHGAIVK